MALLLKTVTAAHGLRWIADALKLFKRKPLAFTSLFAVFLAAAVLVSLVPVLGAVVQMMALPMLSLGFMVAAQSALLDGPVHPRQYLEPLRADPERRRSLLVLCVLYGLLAIAILLLSNAVSDDAWMRLQELLARGAVAQPEIDALLSEPGVLNGLLLAVGLGTALSVPFWHAPALVHWGGQSWGQALFSSTLAVWRNKGAFLVYSAGWAGLAMGVSLIVGLVLSLLGAQTLVNFVAIPAGLAVSAAFYVSLLFCFNDNFGGAAPGAKSANDDAAPPVLPPPADT